MRRTKAIVSSLPSLAALALSVGLPSAMASGVIGADQKQHDVLTPRLADGGQLVLAQLVQDPTVLLTPEAPLSALAPTASGEQVILASNQQIAEIRSGDTVFGLARRYGVSPDTIIIANDLKPPFTLRIGDRLAIPGINQAGINLASREAPVTTPSVFGATPQPVTRQNGTAPTETVRLEPAVVDNVATASIPVATNRPVIQPAIAASAPPAQNTAQQTQTGLASQSETYPVPGPGVQPLQPRLAQLPGPGQSPSAGQASPVIRPVSQSFGGGAQTIRSQKIHEVQAGETLYSIARTHGLTVSQLAVANNVQAPYSLSIGQKLILPGHSVDETRAHPERQSRITYPAQTLGGAGALASTREPVAYLRSEGARAPLGVSRFGWPIRGEVIMGYGRDENGRQNDGINIAAPIGTPIKSVADGEVVYRGADLDGYGNLLLIKHADQWVSAYAHTDTMLVQKGDKVRRGQTIAKVGDTGSVGQPQLHFELRHDLQPMDPLAALEGRDAKALAP